MLIYEK